MILGHTRLFRWHTQDHNGKWYFWLYENGADYREWFFGPFETEKEALFEAIALAKQVSFDTYLLELELLVKELNKCGLMQITKINQEIELELEGIDKCVP